LLHKAGKTVDNRKLLLSKDPKNSFGSLMAGSAAWRMAMARVHSRAAFGLAIQQRKNLIFRSPRPGYHVDPAANE
jgi:hypothetical protein